MKIDFSLENMETICDNFFNIVQECLNDFDDELTLSGEGQKDYFEIVIIKNNEVIASSIIKYILIYEYYLDSKLAELAIKSIEKILQYSDRFKEIHKEPAGLSIEINDKEVEDLLSSNDQNIKEDFYE
jgi:hypothetical protein